MSEIIVYKLDEKGQEVWQYPATILERRPTSVRLEAFFNRDDLDLGFVTFKRGDRFVEYFYTDRWYNIFAVYDRDDNRLKGWYCNVCRPAEIGRSAVRCADLALDLWALPAGGTQVLDEEEFLALRLDPFEQENSLIALSELKQLALDGQLPK